MYRRFYWSAEKNMCSPRGNVSKQVIIVHEISIELENCYSTMKYGNIIYIYVSSSIIYLIQTENHIHYIQATL